MTSPTHAQFAGKHIAIFGAGYVGGALARAVIENRGRVTALTRNPSKAAALRLNGVTVLEGDLASDIWHADFPRDLDLVVNCVSSGGAGLAGYAHSYVGGFESLRRWAAMTDLGAPLLYTGSTSVYAQGGGVWVDESMPAEPDNERAQLLRQAESLALSWSGGAAVLRLAGIYGPGRHHLLDQLRGGAIAITGKPDHRLNLIHRDDIVGAIAGLAALRAATWHPVYNVADDAPTPKAEVVNWLAAELGLPKPGFTGQPAGTRRANMPDRRISNQLLRTTTAWAPRYPDFRAGYREILADPA